MTSSEVRRSFLEFFGGRDHQIVRSASLVPADDPTLLFTNAGMNQFKDLFLGREQRSYRRATSSQKCMRVSGKHNDLSNVGPSSRHHTFFEMLGNFSFGDYFKAEAIPFAWTLLTEVWGLPPERLYPTVFKGEAGIPRDDEAHAIWRGLVPADRIVELGLEENFWAMGETGPCGRCSEVHYHRGDDVPCAEPVCRGIDCSCDRYVEIWNNVFMEFNRDDAGGLTPLPAASIDTGMGLERIVAVIQGKLSNYDTDLFGPLLAAIGDQTGRTYGPHSPLGAPGPDDVSMRVVADHLRAMTFLIADGVMPSNEWRGYVLRKIMRRGMRHGKRLGTTGPFLHQLVDVLIAEMGAAYPELPANRDTVVQVVRAEEERFDAVLNDGLPRLEVALVDAEASRVLAGPDVFRLYDTYGLPLDFVEDLASERGIAIDRAGFDAALDVQRRQSRATASFGTDAAAVFQFATDGARDALMARPDQFEGYRETQLPSAEVLALFDEARTAVAALDGNTAGYAVLDRSPFYLEGGGQVSDTGQLVHADSGLVVEVSGMERMAPGAPRAHRVRVSEGSLRVGAHVTAQVNVTHRDAIRRNHTATHLLHAALRDRLGPHVKQAGSLVAPERLRFDFAHGAPIDQATLNRIEEQVNAAVRANVSVDTDVRATQDAIDAGAMALFGEKYGETVRVVSVPGVSMELCGGTHCGATGDIGLFVITQESGVAAGVRRIEAVTGHAAVAHAQSRRAVLQAALDALGVPESQMVDAIERLHRDTKRLTRELEQLKLRTALDAQTGESDDDTVAVGDARLVARRVSGLEKGALRGLADSLRDRLGRGVVVLASESDGKVALVVSVSKDLVGQAHAGAIVKALAPIVGGGGGGRADFAQAGGRYPEKIDDLLAQSRTVVADMLAPQLAAGRPG
ncbi:MAG: alanine--tRNA ligase [Acidobacteria bacterium]|nr:alanine--tRNA ligase [Acidobacteriota bacterium]